MARKGVWEIKGTERKTLREVVYERLKKRIQRGEFKVKERLIEQRLAEDLGVSRTPVREAISKLEQDGLVDKIPQGGAVVKGTTKDEIEEVFGLRVVLESYAAALATEKINEEILQSLDAVIEKQHRALERRNVNRYIELNTQFHDLLYSASQSDKLYQIITFLRNYIYKYRVFLLRMEEMPKISLRDHQLMLQAMKEGDAQKVEELVKKHILRAKETLLKEIEGGKLSLE
ncbi:MAG: GntR family transcriptional regulator [Deltaproteobacteria bacterium]|nr:MAG: GntR family transcriptional regulator [Deltaproteobacteria bacterium]